MNIFIISNSFIESTVVLGLEYVIDEQINSILLLEENHSEFERILNNKKVILCKNIDEALKYCDIALIIQHKEFPINTIEKIQYLCTMYDKKYLCIKSPWDITNEYRNIIDETLDYINTPTVVLVSIGQYHQLYHTELMINKILSDLNVVYYQNYSCETKCILDQISENIKNVKKGPLLAKNKSSYQIITVQISCKTIECMLTDKNLSQIMNCISPDFLIINTEAGLSSVQFDHLKNLFLYKFNISIGMFIMSNYVGLSIDNEGNDIRPLYYEHFPNNNNIYINSDDGLETILRKKMLSKIALPQDVKFL